MLRSSRTRCSASQSRAGAVHALTDRKGGLDIERHRVPQAHRTGLDETEPAGKFRTLEQPARGEEVEVVGEAVARHQSELRPRREAASRRASARERPGGRSRCGWPRSPRSPVRGTTHCLPDARCGSRGFTRCSSISRRRCSRCSRVLTSVVWSASSRRKSARDCLHSMRIVRPRAVPRSSALRSKSGPRPSGASPGAVEPARDVDAPAREWTADLDRDRTASQPPQPRDGESFQFTMLDRSLRPRDASLRTERSGPGVGFAVDQSRDSRRAS